MLLTDEEVYALTMSTGGQPIHGRFVRAIESAVLAKLQEQGPVCWITPDGEGWRMRIEPPVSETKLGWTPLYAAPVPAIPAGYALVPVEPTEEMIDAGVDAALAVSDSWCAGDETKSPHAERHKAMIQAAPACRLGGLCVVLL